MSGNMIGQLLKPTDLVGLPEHIEECLECGRSRCIAFNPAGTLLASGCEEGEVVIWDCCTRGPARVYQGHRSPVVFVGWSGSGRRLVSASLDGRVVQWDVLSGAQLAALDLGGEGGESSGVAHASLDPADDAQLLVSFQQGPAQLVDLRSGGRMPLPAFVLESKKGGARVLANPPEVAQLAVLSACGRLVFAATRGAVAVHRRSDLALLDMIVLQNAQMATMLSHGRSADSRQCGWLLVISQDRAVRAYQVAQQAEQAEPHDVAELQDVSTKPPRAGTSLLRGAEGPLLIFSRQFQDSLEKKPWSCAAFSTDMEHVAGGMNNKHAIQRWNLYDGISEGTLEGGKDGVVAMAWHPIPLPMQLYTVGSTGRIYIWTKIERENWDCFAPDFEELEENREYVEREDEFDANPRPEDEEIVEAMEGDEEVDIMGGAEQGGNGGGGGEGPPLRFLPVTVADIEAALQRERGQQLAQLPKPDPQQAEQQQQQQEEEGGQPSQPAGAEPAAGEAAAAPGGPAEAVEGLPGESGHRREGSSAPSEPQDGLEGEEGGAGKRKRPSD